MLLLTLSCRRFTTTLLTGFEKAAQLPTPRNAYASGNGCLPVTLIQIYLLSQRKLLQLSKADAAPSCQRRATALRLLAGWVRHGVGNHGRDIYQQLERVIENSSMLSSARGQRQALGTPDWHEGRGDVIDIPTGGHSLHPTVFPAECLSALAPHGHAEIHRYNVHL